MKLLRTAIVVTMLGTAAMMQTAQANITLASLAGGGTITYGNLTFSDFSYNAGNLTSFNAADVNVAVTETAGVYYLTWAGNISLLSGNPPATADLELQYAVTANAGAINSIDQSYNGNGLITVTETVSTGSFGGTVVANSTLTEYDLSDPPVEPGDNLGVVPAQTLLYVTKDISLGDLNNDPYPTLSAVTQSFHGVPVPEATTVIAGALLMLPLGVSTLRILRRNRIA